MAEVILVNEQDEVIGAKERALASDDDIARVTGLWIENLAGEVLLAKRSADKRYDPLKWGISVAGTVEVGETYLSNILKEAEEEIGLKLREADLSEVGRVLVHAEHAFWYRAFKMTADITLGELAPQKEEVAALRFVTKGALRQEFSEHPEHFTRSFEIALAMMIPKP